MVERPADTTDEPCENRSDEGIADRSADRSDEDSVAHRSDGGADVDPPEIACALTGEQVERRRAWIEDSLVPHLEDVVERDDGYSFVFDRSPETYWAVAELAWKESRCCSWAAFGVELPPAGDSVVWHVRSDREGGPAFLDEALEETLRALDFRVAE